jgi:superfamily II DNA or RNA helicase
MRQMIDNGPSGSEIKPWPANKRLAYVVDIPASIYEHRALSLEIRTQTADRSGEWGPPKSARVTFAQLPSIPDLNDRMILQMLVGASAHQRYHHAGNFDSVIPTRFALHARDYEMVLKPICESGHCFAAPAPDSVELVPLTWDDGLPWELWIELNPDESGERYSLEASLRRGEERMDGLEPLLVLSDGLLIARGRVSRLEHFGAFAVLGYLRHEGPVTLAVQQGDELLSDLLTTVPLPRLQLPEQLKVQQVSPAMKPRLKVMPSPKRSMGDNKLLGVLSFDYDGKTIAEHDNQISSFDPQTRTIIRRDAAAERAASSLLDSVGFKSQWDWNDGTIVERRLSPTRLSRVVLELCAAGWHVEAQGKLYRQPGEFKINVSSGIDWFELNGDVDFGGTSASLPRLLTALKKGEKTVQLDDGTVGILPDQWLSRYGLLARVANQEAEDGKVRFSLRQVGLLDALLSAVPQATCDATFESARQELRRFDGIAPTDPPPQFVGTLRPYQRDGLGWLHFLNRFGFGGCLADDMGLGKTVQVLALLQARRQIGKPSLVVVPKSLVFNWIEEAKRFTPDLRVLDHTGIARARSSEQFKDFDIVLTTYGTMRLDAPFLKDVDFDYVVLDEAQAIKNASSESAKAARLLRADHRLVLSGTPVQNHLGELWSLFEFLNPGMLGGASVFKASGAGSSNPIDREGRELLSRALRPFILRRTKEQVATDLPEKTEQTIWCDLEPEQRKLYDELREHYRVSLLERVAAEGINKAKIQVLEALLRLRQAACHPGLIDKNRTDESSAKLESLIEQVSEVLDEGHKVLVFSQFTSMLAIVRKHLDKRKITYEYLDGKTRDRQQRVERFQNDPDCKLFLISLKAGGLGLNLTAAEYVFLLDPWWNPAIESQAIDRAHRIGQTRNVFAYRLIARDTVEQKVLELQSRKKALADMIINADNSLIGELKREDLEMLLA